MSKFKLVSGYSRRFSEPLKRHIVEKIKKNHFTVSEASRLFNVSQNSVYQWLHKFGGLPTGTRQVVEMESEGKKFKDMEAKIASLEQALGRKQMELDFANKLIDISSEELNVDIRKKGSTPLSTGSGRTSKSTPTS